jgi:hypothetical protein
MSFKAHFSLYENGDLPVFHDSTNVRGYDGVKHSVIGDRGDGLKMHPVS